MIGSQKPGTRLLPRSGNWFCTPGSGCGTETSLINVLFCLKSYEEWSQAGGQKEPLYSMIHPTKCRIFPVGRAEWILRGMFTPLPTTYSSAKCGTLVFWSSFKWRKKVTRWQELGNANFSNRSCCFGWCFLCRRIGSAWSVPTKMFFRQWHTQLEIVFAIGSIYGNSSVCVRCELRAWSTVHYQSYWRLFKEWEVHVFFPTM